MQVKGKRSAVLLGRLAIVGAFALAAGLSGNVATAQVVGECRNCHTMHNSQDGNTEVFAGDGARWNAGALSGGTSSTQQAQLLKTDCVGCHSSTGTATILTIGGSKVPIVFNTGGYPNGLDKDRTPLAGGNFFHVATQEGYGHNVAGISSADQTLLWAPGDTMTGCNNSCHVTLTLVDPAAIDAPDPEHDFGGCKGCHTKVGHHNANDTTYRFLAGHGAPGMDEVDGGGVPNSYEDNDWEQTKGSADHNFYKRQATQVGSGPGSGESAIGAFCAGCHADFHSMGLGPTITSFIDNGGDPNTEGGTGLISANSASNPWLRHPTGVNIPNDGEYAVLFTGPADYSPDVPVAQDPAGDPDVIDTGDQVMCLSCHRAHGSDRPDALRFNYNLMSAHTAQAADLDTGCFYCHRSKDS